MSFDKDGYSNRNQTGFIQPLRIQVKLLAAVSR